MESDNGRRSSEAYSSSSDFYSAPDKSSSHHVSLPPARPSPPAPSHIPRPHHEDSTTDTLDHHDADDEGSSDAMDLSTDSSRAGSPPPQHVLTPRAGQKRKAGDIVQSVEKSATPREEEATKKPKLSIPQPQVVNSNIGPFLGLPVELWQQIFLNLPPAMLGRCLSVCRPFNTYLTQIKGSPSIIKSKDQVSVKESEAIWTYSRKMFYPNLPKPLSRCTELQMLQLVGGYTCQFCHRQLPRLHAIDPLHAGPGSNGLRTVWPFAIRTCGKCLEKITVKDTDVLQSNSSVMKELRFGLPYIFLTKELHFIPASQRETPIGIPPNLRASKVYYTRDIGRISAELEEAKSLGDGAVEEWKKGLRAKGQAELNEASRWERWEASAPSGKDIIEVLREYDVSSFPRNLPQDYAWPIGGFFNGTQQPPAEVVNGTNTMPYTIPSFQNGFQSGYTYGPQYPVASAAYPQPPKPVRDATQVLAIREARQKDIERRCLELEPPMEPAVLQYCQAYQDAMQINQPMTDAFWDNVLKPRILVQREEAELQEHERQIRHAALNAGFCAPGALDFTKSGKDLRDKEYEAVQQPLRKRLGEYAQKCIDETWNGAHHLDKENCTAFAVDVLLDAQKKYLLDRDADTLPHIDLPSRAGTPIPEPFLSLDNMKWVFENKIRPLTDPLRRELFVCADCTEDKKPTKWFAFEGLIQHYGAKHTSAFSKGNVVVQWEASDWPEDPPFYEHPLKLIASEKKAHARHRNTPHTPGAYNQGPYSPPAASRLLLSENPLFSRRGPRPSHPPDGHHRPSTAESAYSYGGHLHPFAAPPEPSIDKSEAAQVNKLSNDAREIWDALEGVKDLLDCVRLQAAIHHSVQRFWTKYSMMPSLDLLTDALAGNAQILPVKNASGLACQICVAGRNSNYQSYYARIQGVKLYTISGLVTHYKLLHLPQAAHAQALWTTQMIELPEQQMISDLIGAPGMDDDKLAVLAAAFPWAFPNPLPRIGLVRESTQDVGAEKDLPGRMLERLTKKPKAQPKKKGARGANGANTSGRGSSSEPMPEPREDEYDPTRPIYNPESKLSEVDPARFDTDIRRARDAASAASTINYPAPPASLASLNNFSALQLQNQQQVYNDSRERSPSVGRTESRNSTVKPMASAPTTQPDISAILASLLPVLQPMQTNTPPKTTSNRSDSGPKYPATDPYGKPYGAPSSALHEETRPITHYSTQPSHHGSVEYSPPFQDQHLQNPAAHNLQSFQQNQARTYVEPTYAPTNPAQRVRLVYGEGGSQQYAQQVQPAPVYREHPLQYIQLPPAQSPPAATPYLYEQPRPTRYVDSYGRQLALVPIDNQPAPIQYVPHPYEQQQQQQQYYAAPQPQTSPPSSVARAQPGFYGYGTSAFQQHPPPPSSSGHHSMYE